MTDMLSGLDPAERDFAAMLAWFCDVHPKGVHTPWCGCGTPEDALTFIRDALRAAPWHEPAGKAFWGRYDDGAAHILAGVLDDLGLVEHGGSWYSSWLTEQGKRVLATIEAIPGDGIGEMYDAWSNETAGCRKDECPWCAEIARWLKTEARDDG